MPEDAKEIQKGAMAPGLFRRDSRDLPY